MSRKIAELVYSRRVGSSAKKAVLCFFAEKANEHGREIYPSKQTIADATELNKSTVIRAINGLVSDGLIRAVGTRKCVSGATIVYAMDLSEITSLKPASDGEAVPERDPMQSQSGAPSTPQEVAQRHPMESHSATPSQNEAVAQCHPIEGKGSHSATGGVAQRHPMESHSATQTVLEPSMNQVSTPHTPQADFADDAHRDAASVSEEVSEDEDQSGSQPDKATEPEPLPPSDDGETEAPIPAESPPADLPMLPDDPPPARRPPKIAGGLRDGCATPVDEFNLIWPHYPRKVGKGAARTAWLKARRKATFPEITGPLGQWIRLQGGTPVDKLPHLATWLNQERWEDDQTHARNRAETTTDRLNRLGADGNGNLQLDGAPTRQPPKIELRM